MSGETRGKLLEALVVIAIKAHLSSRISIVAWDEKVEDLKWKPDIYAISSKFPTLFLVTWAGSENNSQEKFWRNLAEAINAKRGNPDITIISFIAGELSRPKFRKLQEKLFSGVIISESLPSSNNILNAIETLSKGKVPKENRDEWLYSKLKEKSLEKELRLFIKNLADIILSLLDCETKAPRSFWEYIPSITNVPSARATRYRHGLAKLALLDSNDAKSLKNYGAIPYKPAHRGLIDIGLLRQFQNTVKFLDSDLVYITSRVANSIDLANSIITPTGISCRQTFRDALIFSECSKFLCDSWCEFKNENDLLNLLVDGHANYAPHVIFKCLKSILSEQFGGQGSNWIEIVARETGIVRSVLIGLKFPKFERGITTLDKSILQSVAKTLYELISVKIKDSPLNSEKSYRRLLQIELSNRQICHGISGLDKLIVSSIKSAGFNVKSGRLNGSLAAMMGYSDRDMSLTKCLWVNDRIVIHFRTGTKSGKEHKLKEMCSRIYQSKLEWSNERFCVIDKLKAILVVDGSWCDDDIRTLISHGWDAVYYPDDIDFMLRDIKSWVMTDSIQD